MCSLVCLPVCVVLSVKICSYVYLLLSLFDCQLVFLYVFVSVCLVGQSMVSLVKMFAVLFDSFNFQVPGDTFSFLSVNLFIAIDALLYAILVWYIDSVFPGNLFVFSCHTMLIRLFCFPSQGSMAFLVLGIFLCSHCFGVEIGDARRNKNTPDCLLKLQVW